MAGPITINQFRPNTPLNCKAVDGTAWPTRGGGLFPRRTTLFVAAILGRAPAPENDIGVAVRGAFQDPSMRSGNGPIAARAFAKWFVLWAASQRIGALRTCVTGSYVHDRPCEQEKKFFALRNPSSNDW